MKANTVFLLLPLLIIASLSSCLLNQRSALVLDLNIGCGEYFMDGFDENGEWVPMGQGSNITLDGKINYDSSMVSQFGKLLAKITVFGVDGLQLHDEISVELNTTGVSTFQKKLDFSDSVDCIDQKFSIAFYSPGGKMVSHKGDFENSINNPLLFYTTKTPNPTIEALIRTAAASGYYRNSPVPISTQAISLTPETGPNNYSTPKP